MIAFSIDFIEHFIVLILIFIALNFVIVNRLILSIIYNIVVNVNFIHAIRSVVGAKTLCMSIQIFLFLTSTIVIIFSLGNQNLS